jgi:flavin reductase (DIM6/NTAB) family NADH-FMN oxidoreductase RutF
MSGLLGDAIPQTGPVRPEKIPMSDTAVMDTIDPRALRDCCGKFATVVTVVTTRTPEGDHGMTVSAFMSVSLEPPLISVSLDHRSKMLGRVEKSRRFAVNILSQDMRSHALHFAGRSDETLTDLFLELHGLPVLRDAAAIIVADVVQQVEAGDHVLFLGHVRHLDHDLAAAPLLYHAGQFGSLATHPAD